MRSLRRAFALLVPVLAACDGGTLPPILDCSQVGTGTFTAQIASGPRFEAECVQGTYANQGLSITGDEGEDQVFMTLQNVAGDTTLAVGSGHSHAVLFRFGGVDYLTDFQRGSGEVRVDNVFTGGASGGFSVTAVGPGTDPPVIEVVGNFNVQFR